MQAQHLSKNGLTKESSMLDNSPSLSKKVDYTTFSTIYVDTEVFKNYLLLQRRALLQSVAADERLMGEVDTILKQIEAIVTSYKVTLTASDSLGYNKTSQIIPITVNSMSIDNVTILQILKNCIAMLKRNTEERRKAYLQIVRDTEKRYGIGGASKINKKRGRYNRQGV